MKIVQLSINTLSYVKRLNNFSNFSNACDAYKILTKNTCYIWCIVIQN